MTRSKTLQTENSRTLLTVKEKTNTPKTFYQFFAAALGTLGALCAGMCLSWSSPAIPMLQKPDSFLQITNSEGAWLGSLLTLGAFFGAIPTGTFTNICGRKKTLLFFSMPLLISWLMIAFSKCIYAFYAARFLAGLAVGGVSVAAPMYVAEISHISVRGTLGTFFQVQITIGLLLEYILGGTIVDFKFLALTSALLPVVFFVSFIFMPETPVYLYKRGRLGDARDALVRFRGRDYGVDDELMKIDEDIKEATTNKAKLTDLIRCKATLNGLIVSLGLMVFQQLSGINAVLFYTGNIFAETGSSMSPNACAVLVGIVQVIATLLSTLLIDKTGRKILLFVSSSIMSVCLVSLGVYFLLKQTRDLSHFSILPLVSVAVFIVVFSIGLGPIPWIVLGEIFTPKTKGMASSMSAAFNWLLAFTVTNQFQNMTVNFGIGTTFIIFGCISGIGTVFISWVVPETKGKDVDEVQKMLLGNKKTCQANTSTEV